MSATTMLTDPLERMDIEVPARLPGVGRCVATIISPDFESMLDDMLGSLAANGACDDARVVVFVLRGSPGCDEVIARHDAVQIACRARHGVNVASKSVLYSVARMVEADSYLCLDADMLVLSSLAPVFSMVEDSPSERIFACAEGTGDRHGDLGGALLGRYGGEPGDIERMLGTRGDEARYPFVVNDGLFAGGRDAMLALDEEMRAMPGAVAWLDERPDLPWRNEFVFNLALARLRCGAELPQRYNVQLDAGEVDIDEDGSGRLRVSREGGPVGVLHLNGRGRTKYPQLRGRFAAQAR
jgi:hypothetical protein